MVKKTVDKVKTAAPKPSKATAKPKPALDLSKAQSIIGKAFSFENAKGERRSVLLEASGNATALIKGQSYTVDLNDFPKALVLPYQFKQGQIIPVLQRIAEGMNPKTWDEKLVSGEVFFGIPHNTASQDLIKAYAVAVGYPNADVLKTIRRCDVDEWVLKNEKKEEVVL